MTEQQADRIIELLEKINRKLSGGCSRWEWQFPDSTPSPNYCVDTSADITVREFVNKDGRREIYTHKHD